MSRRAKRSSDIYSHTYSELSIEIVIKRHQITSLICPVISLAKLPFKSEHSSACTLLLGGRKPTYHFVKGTLLRVVASSLPNLSLLPISEHLRFFNLEPPCTLESFDNGDLCDKLVMFLTYFNVRTVTNHVKKQEKSGIFTKVRSLPVQFPLLRGMLSYAIIWPSCSIVQEYIEHGSSIENADYARAARFGIFGAFFMAPVFYGWLKYSSRFFKGKSMKTAIIRAGVEQVSYSPLAMAYFFFGMSLLEMKPFSACVNEVKEKFWPTYKVGVVFWPTAQTLNFYYVAEKNRIIFVSAASFVWTVYLAHMKSKEQADPGLKNISSGLIPEAQSEGLKDEKPR